MFDTLKSTMIAESRHGQGSLLFAVLLIDSLRVWLDTSNEPECRLRSATWCGALATLFASSATFSSR